MRTLEIGLANGFRDSEEQDEKTCWINWDRKFFFP